MLKYQAGVRAPAESMQRALRPALGTLNGGKDHDFHLVGKQLLGCWSVAVKSEQDLSRLESKVGCVFPPAFLTPPIPNLKNSHSCLKVMFKPPASLAGIPQPEQLQAPGF